MNAGPSKPQREDSHPEADGGAVRHPCADAGVGGSLWRLADPGTGQLSCLGGAESKSAKTLCWRREASFLIARDAWWWTTILPPRASWSATKTEVDADLPADCQGCIWIWTSAAPRCGIIGFPGVQPIPIKQEVIDDERAFIAAHKNELRSWKPSTWSGGCIRAMALLRI